MNDLKESFSNALNEQISQILNSAKTISPNQKQSNQFMFDQAPAFSQQKQVETFDQIPQQQQTKQADQFVRKSKKKPKTVDYKQTTSYQTNDQQNIPPSQTPIQQTRVDLQFASPQPNQQLQQQQKTMKQTKSQYTTSSSTKQRFAQDDIIGSQDSVTTDQMNDIFAKPTFTQSKTTTTNSKITTDRTTNNISNKPKNDPSISSLYGKDSPKRDASSRRDRFSSTIPQQSSKQDEQQSKTKYKDAEPSVSTCKLYNLLGVNA